MKNRKRYRLEQLMKLMRILYNNNGEGVPFERAIILGKCCRIILNNEWR